MNARRQHHSEKRRWLRTRGFPALVLGALIFSAYLAASVRVPNPVPDFALQAASVYRLEVGAACFAVFYMAIWALVLALDITDHSLNPRGRKPPSTLKEKRSL